MGAIFVLQNKDFFVSILVNFYKKRYNINILFNLA